VRERIGRRIDRRIAVSCLLLVIAVLVPITAASETSSPPAPTHDAAAADALVAQMRSGEQSDAVLEYTFTRTRGDDGRSLSSPLTEVRYGEAAMSQANDSLTIQLPTVAYRCQRVDDGASCYKRDERAPVPVSTLLRTAVDSGAYDVTRAPAVEVAGERAECFVVRSRVSGEIPGLGHTFTTCLAPGGIPLRTQVEAVNSTDTWEAVSVRRDIDRAAVQQALPGFEQAVELLPR
jgi:hypothetical protein